RALCQRLEAGTSQEQLIAKVLIHSLSSSPAALEGVLRRLLERRDEIGAEIEDSGEGGLLESSTDLLGAGEARAIAARALEALEALQVDAKLTALGALLGSLSGRGTETRRICVVTEYVGTLYYLAADIEGRAMEYSLLHGEMSYGARQESL